MNVFRVASHQDPKSGSSSVAESLSSTKTPGKKKKTKPAYSDLRSEEVSESLRYMRERNLREQQKHELEMGTKKLSCYSCAFKLVILSLFICFASLIFVEIGSRQNISKTTYIAVTCIKGFSTQAAHVIRGFGICKLFNF